MFANLQENNFFYYIDIKIWIYSKLCLKQVIFYHDTGRYVCQQSSDLPFIVHSHVEGQKIDLPTHRNDLRNVGRPSYHSVWQLDDSPLSLQPLQQFTRS